MKKKYPTVGTILKFNRKTAEIDKIDTLTHTYMTAYLMQAGLN
jgi:hypothetical protein